MSDLEDLRALLVAYNIAGDRGRLAELASVFAEDGHFAGPGVEATGPAGIVAALSDRKGRETLDLRFTRHHLTTSQIKIDGDRGSGRTYFLAVTNTGPDHSGVYVDEYKKQAGQWRIARREVRIDWVSDASRMPFLHQHVRSRLEKGATSANSISDERSGRQ